MIRVYLSYAPEDEARADELRRILMAQGHRPWRDRQPIEIDGGSWRYEMEAAIRQSDALILLVTRAAASSTMVTYEWALALGANRPVFAIIYEDAPEHPRLSAVPRYDARSFGDENHFWDHFVADFNQRAAAQKQGPIARQPAPEYEIDRSVMPTEPGYWIVMRRGPLPNQLYQLDRAVVNIGRDLANDVVIRDGQVSRFHLRLSLQGQDYCLEDLGSANGARVNGRQIAGRTRLNDGDVIALGDSVRLSYDLVYPE